MEVWNSQESHSDYDDAIAYCLMVGLSSEQIDLFIKDALTHAEEQWKQPNVQRAIYTLAEALPSGGRMSGMKAYRIIARALADQSDIVDSLVTYRERKAGRA